MLPAKKSSIRSAAKSGQIERFLGCSLRNWRDGFDRDPSKINKLLRDLHVKAVERICLPLEFGWKCQQHEDTDSMFELNHTTSMQPDGY